jgi:hypothetical protein
LRDYELRRRIQKKLVQLHPAIDERETSRRFVVVVVVVEDGETAWRKSRLRFENFCFELAAAVLKSCDYMLGWKETCGGHFPCWSKMEP